MLPCCLWISSRRNQEHWSDPSSPLVSWEFPNRSHVSSGLHRPINQIDGKALLLIRACSLHLLPRQIIHDIEHNVGDWGATTCITRSNSSITNEIPNSTGHISNLWQEMDYIHRTHLVMCVCVCVCVCACVRVCTCVCVCVSSSSITP